MRVMFLSLAAPAFVAAFGAMGAPVLPLRRKKTVMVFKGDQTIEDTPLMAPSVGAGGGESRGALGGGSAGRVPGPMTQEEKQLMLQLHNDRRRSEGSSDMLEMTYSEGVASLAQAWADNCVYEHSASSVRDFNGENLAIGMPSRTVESSIEGWIDSERPFYDYSDGSCVPGEQCGHYTQAVWATSYQLGCGVSRCVFPEYDSTGEWTYWVCHYKTAGNVNHPPNKPFKKGAACSECPQGSSGCNDGLCTVPCSYVPCENQYGNCDSLAQQGCDFSFGDGTLMSVACALACDTCPVQPTGGCTDTTPATTTTPITTITATTITTIAPTSAPTQQPIAPPPAPAPGASEDCLDQSPQCGMWRDSFGDVCWDVQLTMTNGQGDETVTMLKDYCGCSCPYVCVDQDDMCPMYSMWGYCSQLEGWCDLSCGFCQM